MLFVAIVASVLAAGIGSLAVAIGLRTGSSEAVQGSFPLLFASLFMSSAFFPRELMHGWFKSVASFNPLSHLIEGLRTQIIVGVDVSAWLTSLAAAAGIFTLGVVLAGLALRGRLAGHL
jgi:ABC-2 type transport system permease protein